MEYKYKKIYVLGDIHGDFEHLCNIIRRLESNSLLIQLGDFGLGFKSEHRDLQELEWINNVLIEKDVHLFTYRGNHDQPLFWNKNLQYSNLKLIQDYTSLVINNKKCLFVGGAASVDRMGRQICKNYWADEGIKYLNRTELNKLSKTDYLFLHSAPDFCFPRGYDAPIVLDWAKHDKDLIDDLKKERKYLSDLTKIVCPSKVFFGHFHNSRTEIIENCEYNLLDINELKELE